MKTGHGDVAEGTPLTAIEDDDERAIGEEGGAAHFVTDGTREGKGWQFSAWLDDVGGVIVLETGDCGGNRCFDDVGSVGLELVQNGIELMRDGRHGSVRCNR